MIIITQYTRLRGFSRVAHTRTPLSPHNCSHTTSHRYRRAIASGRALPTSGHANTPGSRAATHLPPGLNVGIHALRLVAARSRLHLLAQRENGHDRTRAGRVERESSLSRDLSLSPSLSRRAAPWQLRWRVCPLSATVHGAPRRGLGQGTCRSPAAPPISQSDVVRWGR